MSEIAYGLRQPPAGWVWSTKANRFNDSLVKYSGTFLPRIGARVRITHGKWGWGVVDAYFVEYGWMGVEIRVERYPAWYKAQQKRNGEQLTPVIHIFGIELDAIDLKREVVDLTSPVSAPLPEQP